MLIKTTTTTFTVGILIVLYLLKYIYYISIIKNIYTKYI